MSLFSGKNGVTMGTGNEFGTPVHLTNETILGGTMGKKNKISLIHWMHVPQIHGGCPRLLHGHRPHPVIFVPIEEHIFEIESIPFPPTVLPRSAQLQLPLPLRSNEQLPLISSSCTFFARMVAPTGDPLPYTTSDASPLGSTWTCCWILSY